MNSHPRPTPVEHHDAVVRRLREIVDNAQQPGPETPPPPPPKPKRGALFGFAAIVVGIVALAAVAAVVYSVTRPKSTPTAQTPPAQPATAPLPMQQQNATSAQPSDEEMAAAKKRLGDALLKMAKPADAPPPPAAAPAPAAEPAQTAAPPQVASAPPKVEARPEPAAPRPAPQPTVSADDASKMLARASSLIREGQIASARSLLQLALRANDPSVAFALAETYDPKTLARWRAIGITGDVERARALYKQAADGGVAEAGARLSDLDR